MKNDQLTLRDFQAYTITGPGVEFELTQASTEAMRAAPPEKGEAVISTENPRLPAPPHVWLRAQALGPHGRNRPPCWL